MAIQLKRSLASELNTAHVLKQGQLGISMPGATNTAGWDDPDNHFDIRIGDGTSRWSQLPSVCPPLARYMQKLFTVSMYKRPNLTSSNVIRLEMGPSGWWYSLSELRLNLEHVWNGSTGSQNTCYNSYFFDTDDSSSSTFYGAFYCVAQRGNNAGEPTLGTANRKWKTVYSSTGSIQTSDRSAKTNIHSIEESQIAMTDLDGNPTTSIGLEDVISFIQQINPVTFDYKVNGLTPENRQLGLIADDIEDTRLFPYIGCRLTWEANEEKQVEAGSSLALKPIPLAVAALAACKYLLQRINLLEEQQAG